MARSGVILFSALQPSDIGFGPSERNQHGGKFVPLTGPDGVKRRITIQTPTMSMPFGVSAYREKPDGDVQSYSVDVSFKDLEANPKVAEFLAKMEAIDALLVDTSVARSVEWFGRQKSRDTLDDNYRTLIKVNKEGKYPPVMKIKVPLNREGKPTCAFFDEKRNPVDIDYLVNGTKVKMIIEVDRVWFVNNTFGITWRAAQLAVVSRPSNFTSEYSMLDDDNDDMAVLGLTGGADDNNDLA